MQNRLKINPPGYLLICLVLMFALRVWLPLCAFIEPPQAYAGLVAVLFGILVSATSSGLFKKAGTGVEPFSEASVLVTSGLYLFSRNPMYVGMFIMLLGFAFMMGRLGALLPLPFFVMIIRKRFVMPEESFLEAAFGQPYLDYKSRVRRWI